MPPAAYLMLVGAGMAWYAGTLDVGPGPDMMGGGYEVPGTDMGPTPMQQYYGAFGGLTLVIGLMALVFGLLSFFFNLLPTLTALENAIAAKKPKRIFLTGIGRLYPSPCRV